MEKIATARIFLQNLIEENNQDSNIDLEDAMIEFAKMHVEAALKEASKEAAINKNKGEVTARTFGNVINGTYSINQQSILNSYPFSNIK